MNQAMLVQGHASYNERWHAAIERLCREHDVTAIKVANGIPISIIEYVVLLNKIKRGGGCEPVGVRG